MANNKENSEPPAYIDYTGDASAVTPDQYTTTNFRDYWRKSLARKHRMAALPITIKEKTLWKRLVQQYEPDDLIAMIDKWMDIYGNPAEFVHFYTQAQIIHSMIKPKDYEW